MAISWLPEPLMVPSSFTTSRPHNSPTHSLQHLLLQSLLSLSLRMVLGSPLHMKTRRAPSSGTCASSTNSLLWMPELRSQDSPGITQDSSLQPAGQAAWLSASTRRRASHGRSLCVELSRQSTFSGDLTRRAWSR